MRVASNAGGSKVGGFSPPARGILLSSGESPTESRCGIDALEKFVSRWKNTRPYGVARDVQRRLEGAVEAAREVDRRVATLAPGDAPPRGDVLLAYLVAGFFEDPGSRLLRSHTQYWESMEIARAWRDLGYRVDVIDNYNAAFRPRRDYDVLIGARMALEQLGRAIENRRRDGELLKILHIDVDHWLVHNGNEIRRLAALAERRGRSLIPHKVIERNRAIEYADCATNLGNDYTAGTFAFARKPIWRVPISSTYEGPWPEGKDFEAARRRFVWMGGPGLVHKGLDLVLEAFAGMPDLELVVCGPLEQESDFRREYRTELYATPNVRIAGWVDVESPTFHEIVRDCVAVVVPSAGEGGCGAVIVGMHAGLIPAVTRETSVDVRPDCGVMIPEATVDEVRRAVRALAAAPADRLRDMSHAAWEFVRRQHTRSAFARNYREAAREILATRGILAPAVTGAETGSSPEPVLRPEAAAASGRARWFPRMSAGGGR